MAFFCNYAKVASVINAEVIKNDNETDTAVIRRFQKRVQGTGLIQRVRGGRYYSRGQSREVRRKHALKVLERREAFQEALKLGKVVETPPKRRR